METLVLKPTEAAELLRVGKNTVIDKLKVGELPGYKDGADWKIPADLLKKYVEDKAMAEMTARKNKAAAIALEREIV